MDDQFLVFSRTPCLERASAELAYFDVSLFQDLFEFQVFFLP